MELKFSQDERMTIIDRSVRFPKAQPIFSLDYLMKVNNDEVDWASVNNSWVISRELQGRRVLIAVRNRNIFKNYGKAGTMDAIDADFDVELEAVEVGDKTICLDVMSIYGVSIQDKNLAQRLGSITEKMAALLKIECQKFYAYDEQTIKMVNEAKVVNFVIQNSLDVYKSQRKRFTRITVDDKFEEKDYDIKKEMVYESTYEIQDVIEVRTVLYKAVLEGTCQEDEVPDVILTNFVKNGMNGQAKPQEHVVLRKVHEFLGASGKDFLLKERKKREKIFRRITDVGLDPVIGFSNYEVSDRVLQKNVIDQSTKAESKDLKRKRKKN